jgi:hypothetical protein
MNYDDKLFAIKRVHGFGLNRFWKELKLLGGVEDRERKICHNILNG